MESEAPDRETPSKHAPRHAADEQSSATVSRGFVHRLAPEKMLPAVCPSCQAPGTRPVALRDDPKNPAQNGATAFYCDICADRRLAIMTRHIAWTAASALLVIAGVTALALAWGTRNIETQLLLGLALTLFSPAIFRRFKLWEQPGDDLRVRASPQGETHITCVNDRFGVVLEEHQIPRVPGTPPRNSPLETHRSSLILLMIFAAWFGLIHSLGGAKVRVIVAGADDAMLLVDARHHERLAASNSEDPRAGIFTRVLGGRRHLEVVTRAGRSLGGVTKTIWPGRTYIVGHLPAGMCFFWERRGYGDNGGKSLFVPLGGDGPVWELRDAVDSWFVPLQAPENAEQDGVSEWASSGGVRRAIRLLPCRPALSQGAARGSAPNGRIVKL